MTEAIIILMNMRGGCATVGEKVHTLFRVTSRGPCGGVKPQVVDDEQTAGRATSPVSSASKSAPSRPNRVSEVERQSK